jgi:TetR/AcrR family transcriptional repressor of nem operon
MPKAKYFDTDAALEKAMELFWKKGYNGTSINDLVDATGLSRSSLYDTYHDKHQLFMASLARYQATQGKAFADELNKHHSSKKKIETIFRATLAAILKDPYGKGCFMVNSATEMVNQDKEIAGFATKDFEGMETLFLSLIKQGQEKGEIAKHHKPKALAHYLFSSYLGLRVLGQTTPDKAKLEDVIRIALSALDA